MNGPAFLRGLSKDGARLFSSLKTFCLQAPRVQSPLETRTAPESELVSVPNDSSFVVGSTPVALYNLPPTGAGKQLLFRSVASLAFREQHLFLLRCSNCLVDVSYDQYAFILALPTKLPFRTKCTHCSSPSFVYTFDTTFRFKGLIRAHGVCTLVERTTS